MRIQELEERLERSNKYYSKNSKINEKAILMGITRTGSARFLAQSDNGIIWTIRDMIDPENHKKKFMTKMELLIYYNSLLDQGFSVYIF